MGTNRGDNNEIVTPRRARIICTLGPATATLEKIVELVEAGMNVARLNMSHGTWEDHQNLFDLVREADRQVGVPVAIMADLQGPKIRLQLIEGDRTELADGATFVLDEKPVPGTSLRASTSHPTLSEDVHVGDTLYIDDGRIELRVTAINGAEVETRVVVGGEISNHKGVNLPSTRLKLPVLNDKDRQDLENALTAGADWIALSFVRRALDAQIVRECMRHIGILRPLVAKIETPQAVEDLDDIVAAFDGIMVARGDLGLETPIEKLPAVQRRAIDLARDLGRPSIVATQMLDSMVSEPTPTRAEVSDVATAIVDGADALMLSAETSVGRFPVRSVRQMCKIIEATEAEPRRYTHTVATTHQTFDSLAKAAINLAEELNASALCVFTTTGQAVRSLARHRAGVPLIALTPRPEVVRALSLTWGVETLLVPMIETMDEMIGLAEDSIRDTHRFGVGETVILLAGTQMGVDQQTNLLRILEIQE